MKKYDVYNNEALFIDGTKLEADANKYSFVWKQAVEKYDDALNEKICALYDELIEGKVRIEIEKDELDTSDALEQMIQAIDEKYEEIEAAIQEEPAVIKGGSKNKQKRRKLKKYRRLLLGNYLPRKKKYENAKRILGDRNSYSKTDHDANFMCMKEDPMKNREVKPGYNVQVATNGQFCVTYDLFPNPTDTRTSIPFLESIEVLDYFKYIVADAGYGSEENYQYVEELEDKIALIPYNMYLKEQTKKYRNDPSKCHNWKYNEDLDCYVDTQGVQFSFYKYQQRTDKYGYKRSIKIYVADKLQATESLDELAKRPS